MFIRFLLRNLKGYRFLVVIAVVMALLQVFSNIMQSLPAKFIGDALQQKIDPRATITPGLHSALSRCISSTESECETAQAALCTPGTPVARLARQTEEGGHRSACDGQYCRY